MLDELYQALDDPAYQGDPTETLLRIDELIGEYDSRAKLEARFALEDIEPDPGLFQEDTDFDIAAFLTPEALNNESLISFNGSAYLQHLMVRGPSHLIPLPLSDPYVAPRTSISQVGPGAEFLRGAGADRQFSRKAPWSGCRSACGKV